MKTPLLLCLLFSISFCFSSYAQLNTTVNSDANQIANYLLGFGVNISNASLNCGGDASGFISNGSTTNLGINEGVALCSGLLSNIPGPNNSGGSSFSSGTGGDADLDSLLQTAVGTNDACVFEFDIESIFPNYDTIAFNYVFGSEEYLEFVFSFNDIFAFFISGPNPAGGDYVNQNIALIPGTNDYVSIDNVNNTINSQYYIDNGNGLSSPQNIDSSYIQYDGFTTVLEAKFAVIPNETYHLKLAVADVLDSALDSGVFIEAGSIFAKPGPVYNSVDQLAGNFEDLTLTNGQLMFENKNETTTLRIIDMEGRTLIHQKILPFNSYNFNLNSINKKLIIICLENKEGTRTQRFKL